MSDKPEIQTTISNRGAIKPTTKMLPEFKAEVEAAKSTHIIEVSVGVRFKPKKNLKWEGLSELHGVFNPNSSSFVFSSNSRADVLELVLKHITDAKKASMLASIELQIAVLLS